MNRKRYVLTGYLAIEMIIVGLLIGLVLSFLEPLSFNQLKIMVLLLGILYEIIALNMILFDRNNKDE